MEALFPVLVVGLGVIALVSFIRAMAWLVRFALVAALVLGAVFIFKTGKLPDLKLVQRQIPSSIQVWR